MDFNPRPRINARAFLKDRYPPFERRSNPDRRSPCRNRPISDRLSNPHRRLRPDRRSPERLSVLSVQVSWFATPLLQQLLARQLPALRDARIELFRAGILLRLIAQSGVQTDDRAQIAGPYSFPSKSLHPWQWVSTGGCSVIEIRKSNLKWESAVGCVQDAQVDQVEIWFIFIFDPKRTLCEWRSRPADPVRQSRRHMS